MKLFLICLLLLSQCGNPQNNSAVSRGEAVGHIQTFLNIHAPQWKVRAIREDTIASSHDMSFYYVVIGNAADEQTVYLAITDFVTPEGAAIRLAFSPSRTTLRAAERTIDMLNEHSFSQELNDPSNSPQ